MSNDELTFEYRDEFKRRVIAEKIINLLMDDEFSPMVLDGDWGVGKTEFCHKLINLIRADQSYEGGTNKNIPRCQCLYIDAFAEDHGDDPLLMLLGNIARFIKDKEGNGDSSERYQKWKNASIAVAKSCFKIGAKAAIGLLLKQNADSIGDEISDAIKKSAEEGVDAIVNDFLQQYEESNSNIETLKSILAEIARDERMIIVVDELDRCRPDFSITLLEKIKHVFDVPNVSFLLVANMRQLGAVISHVYGNGSDISRYIDKFIKIVVSLPCYYDKMSVSRLYLFELMKQGKMSNIFGNLASDFIEYILTNNSHSLRDVEHFARYAKVLESISLHDWQYSECEVDQILSVVAIYLYCFNRDVIKKIISNNIDVGLIFNSLNILNGLNEEGKLHRVFYILESLDPTVNQKEGVGDRGFIIDKEYIFDNTYARSFKDIQRIFIDYIMNLSLVKI